MEFFIKNVSEFFPENPDYEKMLPTEIFDFLKSSNKLHLIRGGVFYRSNRRKKFDTCSLTRVWTADLDFYSLLEQTLDNIDFKCILNIDADFLIETPDQEKPLKFQHGSRGTAMNIQKRVIIPSDLKKVLSEFADLTPADLLNKVYQKHVEILDYRESGFRPHSLLTFKIFITSLQ